VNVTRRRATVEEDAILRGRFLGHWRQCRQPGANDAAEAAWHALAAHYSNPDRHYHDQRHLIHCLAELDLVADRLDRPDQVEAAIWFHDVIIVPGRTDNEQRSADFFRDIAGPVMPDDFVAAVVELILQTTHRTNPTRPDHQFLCDIDLSTFGSPWKLFLENSAAIEAEFPGPREEYVRRETAFLEALARRPRIFLTDHYHDRLEQQARANIRRFLEVLRPAPAVTNP